MIHYEARLKGFARSLRHNMTEAEVRLWARLKGKQISNVRFYRQKPVGNYIVDFYAPKAQLVIELDGSQHFSQPGIKTDASRDEYLASKGLQVLRFHNLQVLKEMDGVLAVISRAIDMNIGRIPPRLFS